MFDVVARQRIALCDQLDGLTEDQWNAASLCGGWRVRDVAGHLVSLMDLPVGRFVVGVVGIRGFHRRVDRFALEYGRREPAELVSLYRSHAGRRRAPPVVGPIAPLTDVVVHALDIQRPLGLAITGDAEATTIVLDTVSRGLPLFVPKARVRGLRFTTTDIEWSAGEGPTVEATSGDLLLALNGRSVPIDAFDGGGAAAFVGRL